jgi:flagellar motor switch protein FliM
MADDLLSQAELDSLLSNLESGLAPKMRESDPHAVPAPHAARFRDSAASLPQESIARQGHYAPTAATRGLAEHLSGLAALHETLARSFSASLSRLLRSLTEIKLASLDEMAYGQFVARLPNPSCSSVIRVAPLAANWVLDINPSVFYAIIDRMLGGGREPGLVARRPLTEIELRLVSRVTRLFLDELARAWKPAVDVEFSVQRVESNPRLVLGAPSHEGMLVASFEARINDVRGPIALGMPVQTLSPAAARLSAAGGRALGKRPDERSHAPADSPGQPIKVTVHLAETRISAAELADLRVGDIIATDAAIDSPLVVRADGVEIFRGRPGTLDGHKALRIDQRLETSDEAAGQ